MKKANWQNVTNVVLGVWYFFSPWIVAHKMAPDVEKMMSLNAWVVGAAIVLVAWAALQELAVWEEWTSLLLGVWLILTPWIFGFVQDRIFFWNSILVGAAVVVTSSLAIPVAQKFKHQR